MNRKISMAMDLNSRGSELNLNGRNGVLSRLNFYKVKLCISMYPGIIDVSVNMGTNVSF